MKEFNNPIAENLRKLERVDLLYAIICKKKGSRILAIKDDGGDGDGYLHLHNDTEKQDNEDLELYERIMDV